MHQSFHNIWLVLSSNVIVWLLRQRFQLSHKLEVFCHVCIQNVFYDLFAHGSVLSDVKLLENVTLVFFYQEVECRCVVVFKHSLVIVQSRQFGASLLLKHVIVSGMINIVCGRRNKETCKVKACCLASFLGSTSV